MRLLKQNFLWILFVGFAIFAIWSRKDASIFVSQGPYPYGKYVIWIIFFAFFAYSIYASRNENFFKSLKKITNMLWGRQIGIDLYIGLLLPMLIILLHGGTYIFLIWLIPVLLYANLATLLYLALNYDSIIQHFII